MIEAKPHPNADRLRVCMVDAGGEPVQVVCGAPNARTGMRSVFSPVGTYIPGKKITLAKGVIRGVESNGMLCSEAELELSQDHDGIIDLPEDAPVGVAYAAYAGLDDPVIDINLTPNRPDATGVSGIARDLAAAGLGTLKTPPPKPVGGGFDCPVKVKLDFSPPTRTLPRLRAAAGARRTNGPSPEWMQRRLRAIGLRPINALVDVTNYLTFDRGRPLHVFDAAKVEGRPHRAPRPRGRKRARARRQDLCARREQRRHRRRRGRRVDRRRDGRRAFGLRRDHDRRADRERAVGPQQHRPHRAQARHRHRRALSFRARRRSGLLRPRRGTGDAAGDAISAAASRRA